MSTACSSISWVPQKHGARQSLRCLNPSFSRILTVKRFAPYALGLAPVTEPAQGAPRAIRGKPTSKFVCIPNHLYNPSRNDAAKCVRPNPRNNNANRPANSRSTTPIKVREAVRARGALVLARERTGRSVLMSGFARRRVSHLGGSGEHRALRVPMNRNCTLWTLNF